MKKWKIYQKMKKGACNFRQLFPRFKIILHLAKRAAII